MATIPKIAMIPSGYKAGKVYSVLPTNGDADLTFTRASEATRVDETGVIETMATGVPRLDYSDGGCPSLLLEPQSTNLVTYSEEFDNVSWSKVRATISANSAISPKGDLTADSLVISDTSSFCYAFFGSTLTQNTTYTFSVFFKLADYSGQISLIDFTENGNVSVNTTTLAISVSGVFSDSKLENYSNGWYRLSGTLTPTIATGNHNLGVSLNATLGAIGEFTYIWGAQIEEQSYATSYISTSGATATRIIETVSKTGLQNYINSREGSLYFYLKFPTNNKTRVFSFSNGSNNTQIRFGSNTIGSFNFYIIKNGLPQVNINGGLNDKNYTKLGIRYKDNDCAFFVNGVKVGSSLSCEMPDANQLTIFKNDQGGGSSGIVTAYTSIKEFEVFNQALTDQELQTLTTL